MGWFKPKQKWERTFRLRSHHSSGRSILAVLFWLWGVAGLLFNAGTLFGLTGKIGVGTSSYLSASCLVWIGGMVLFESAPFCRTTTSMESGRSKKTVATATFELRGRWGAHQPDRPWRSKAIRWLAEFEEG